MQLENIEHKTSTTTIGTWRRFAYPTGLVFEEFTSHKQYFCLPLIHFTHGRCPETGKRIIARGIISIGRLAVGGLAIGHASAALIAVGQHSIGLPFGLGQLTAGAFALGQIALAFFFGVGQISCGYAVIAQLGIGNFILAQKGVGAHVCDLSGCSQVALDYFEKIIPVLSGKP